MHYTKIYKNEDACIVTNKYLTQDNVVIDDVSASLCNGSPSFLMKPCGILSFPNYLAIFFCSVYYIVLLYYKNAFVFVNKIVTSKEIQINY